MRAQIRLLEPNVRRPEGGSVRRDNRGHDVETGIVPPGEIQIARETPVPASEIEHRADVMSVHQGLDIADIENRSAKVGTRTRPAAPNPARVDRRVGCPLLARTRHRVSRRALPPIHPMDAPTRRCGREVNQPTSVKVIVSSLTTLNCIGVPFSSSQTS